MFRDLYFLIGDRKNTQMKIFHVYPRLKCSWYFFLCLLIAKNIHYSAFSDSVDTFRHKNFENRLKNDCFMAIGTLKTCKMDHLLS